MNNLVLLARRLRTWQFIVLFTLAAEILTACMHIALGFLFWGTFSADLLLIGAITAGVVGVLVSSFGIYLIRETTKLTSTNERLLQEITSREQAEKRLLSSETFLQTVIETEPECVKLLDAEGNVLMMNRAGLEMIRADSLDSVKGKGIYPFISPEYVEPFRRLNERVFHGESGTLVFEMTGMHGRRLTLETHAVPLRNEKKEIIASLGITRNITEKRLFEQQREKLISELQDALAEIKTLRGILPICASCKKIRDDQGYWKQIESYIRDHSEAKFSHSICPECAKKLYPEYYADLRREEKK